jgi:transposase
MKYTFKQFQKEYPDDAACLLSVMKAQYGGTRFDCPGCGVEAEFHAMTKRRAYACQECGHHIYPCAGTIFHKSSTKLTNWFFAMYLMTSTRHGVAAKELERQIGCTYKTAWRMAHELRKLMASADFQGPLSGHVEIDDTTIGGHQTRTEKRRKGTNKSVVFGMVERNGRLLAGPIKQNADYVARAVKANVDPSAILSTDDWAGYRDLDAMNYIRGSVNHSDGEYVRGEVHTNTIEGHWSQLKRSIHGTHVHVSAKHLWKYVSEFSYRRNFRDCHSTMFNRLILAFALPRVVEP